MTKTETQNEKCFNNNKNNQPAVNGVHDFSRKHICPLSERSMQSCRIFLFLKSWQIFCFFSKKWSRMDIHEQIEDIIYQNVVMLRRSTGQYTMTSDTFFQKLSCKPQSTKLLAFYYQS